MNEIELAAYTDRLDDGILGDCALFLTEEVTQREAAIVTKELRRRGHATTVLPLGSFTVDVVPDA